MAYAMYKYKGSFMGNAGAWSLFSSNMIKKDEVEALGDNFIVTKALMAFVDQGYIPKVFSCFSIILTSFSFKGVIQRRGN